MRRRTHYASAGPWPSFRLWRVSWEVQPPLGEGDVQAALLEAAEQALREEELGSVWWRSGLEDLGGGPAPEQAWRDAGIVEP
jgi:hypothetical protein